MEFVELEVLKFPRGNRISNKKRKFISNKTRIDGC